MKKVPLLTLLLLLTSLLALPVSADDGERHQSYLSYDEGGTIVRSAEDGKDVEAHRNLPVYPGDEVVTARRGRAEVHLSDGNIIGIDRATAIRFRSILDSYESDDNETVAELRYGKVAVQRTDIGRDHVRLDTENASYVASREAIYSVETDSRGSDRVTVFEGSIEVRTPTRSSRLRAGDAASVDDRGVFDLVGDQRYSADDFERWFLKRAERFGNYTSRYMDRRLSYWNDDLDDHGRWVFITGIGWGWRPYVGVGWRPYYNGYWSHRRGCLTWVSYDPWGWGTYHYGRWSYDPFQGWYWLPGYGYSPAWVYWWYGPSYIGWAPSGWWDCHRGYYDWAYRPYRHTGVRIGAGFYGRVRVADLDLRPWTFVDSGTIVSGRIDRAALTTDAIRGRLGRDNGGFATISSGPSRFTREQLRDPAESIRRRGLGNDQGIEAGTPADLTPYFRRDAQISGTIRDRIIRSRGSVPVNASGGSSNRGTVGGGSVAPIGGGSLAPIGGGSVAPIGGGSVAPIGGARTEGTDGRITRGGGATGRVIGSEPATSDDSGSGSGSGSARGSWRDRLERPSTGGGSSTPSTSPAPDNTPSRSSGGDTWRRRVRGGDDSPSTSAPPPSASSSDDENRGSSDVPRRVIDRIGGARIVPRERDDNSSSGGSTPPSTRESEPSRESPRPTARERYRGDSGSRDSGGSSRESGGSRGSGGSSVDRGGSSRSSGSGNSGSNNSGSSNNSGGNRESGGRIKRDH